MQVSSGRQVIRFKWPLLAFFSLALLTTPVTSARAADKARSTDSPDSLARWCAALRAEVSKLRWKADPCTHLTWATRGRSVEGRPLVYGIFGDPNALNTTLIFSGVHGDEITPLYLAIQLAHWLQDHSLEMAKSRIVLAPMLNPDGFFRAKRTRTNADGVDVNRNFPTRDWARNALRAWKLKFHSDPRRYPGPRARSEPETVFQQELIRMFRPQKILSIHSPLNFLDYDGPTQLSLSRFPGQYVRTCLRLRSRMGAISSGFFPGSLGNYAGHDLGIPTLTLELPSADPAQAERYWRTFSRGIRAMIQFNLPDYASGPSHDS